MSSISEYENINFDDEDEVRKFVKEHGDEINVSMMREDGEGIKMTLTELFKTIPEKDAIKLLQKTKPQTIEVTTDNIIDILNKIANGEKLSFEERAILQAVDENLLKNENNQELAEELANALIKRRKSQTDEEADYRIVEEITECMEHYIGQSVENVFDGPFNFAPVGTALSMAILNCIFAMDNSEKILKKDVAKELSDSAKHDFIELRNNIDYKFKDGKEHSDIYRMLCLLSELISLMNTDNNSFHIDKKKMNENLLSAYKKSDTPVMEAFAEYCGRNVSDKTIRNLYKEYEDLRKDNKNSKDKKANDVDILKEILDVNNICNDSSSNKKKSSTTKKKTNTDKGNEDNIVDIRNRLKKNK